MVPDRDQAWRDFAGWRVNYDQTLLALAVLLDVPYAPWTADRSPAMGRPTLGRPGGRRRARVPVRPWDAGRRNGAGSNVRRRPHTREPPVKIAILSRNASLYSTSRLKEACRGAPATRSASSTTCAA